jgi:hypothetical protein
MSRRERRTKIGGQFSAHLIEMIESPAWRVLSLSARRVLDRIEIEMAHHGGTDNGRLPVTYDNFEEYGIHRHAISPAIREACALGFLEVTEHGGGGNREFQRPNLFRLTYRHAKDVQGDGTHEWRHIQTLEEAELKAKQARFLTFKKQKTGGGKRHVSVPETTTENGKSPVAETTTASPVRKPPLLSISRGGGSPSEEGRARADRSDGGKSPRLHGRQRILDGRARVRAALATGPRRTTDLMAALGLPDTDRGAIDALLFKMVAAGELERPARGRYALSQK